MASLSRATSMTHSADDSSEGEEDAAPGPSGKASFSSQRSGSPFTAKRDKSFADVQRFLGDSLNKSASKGMSFAKQLQVGLQPLHCTCARYNTACDRQTPAAQLEILFMCRYPLAGRRELSSGAHPCTPLTKQREFCSCQHSIRCIIASWHRQLQQCLLLVMLMTLATSSASAASHMLGDSCRHEQECVVQVMMKRAPSSGKRHRVKRMATFSGQPLPGLLDQDGQSYVAVLP